MAAARAEILKVRVRGRMDPVNALARLSKLLCKVWKSLSLVVIFSEQTKSTSSCGEWCARRRLISEGLLSSETLFVAFRAKAYRGKIPRVTAILAVGRLFSRDSVYVDKTKSVISDCGILQERKRNWGDEFAGKFGIVKRTMKSL